MGNISDKSSAIMRIPIREQLALMVLFISLTCLMVLALAVWFQSHNFIIDVKLSTLSLTASLKAAQLSATLNLYQSSVAAISTRILLQPTLTAYNNGNTSQAGLDTIIPDLSGALSGFGTTNLLMQAIIFPLHNNVPGSENGIVNVTGPGILGTVQLPYTYPNGSAVFLGDPDPLGYPTQLYPNFTYVDGPDNTTQMYFENRLLTSNSTVFVGPFTTNASFSLFSVTMAINNNTSRQESLGWITVVLNAYQLYKITGSPEGLQNTGEILLVGPVQTDNKFSYQIRGSLASNDTNDQVRFVLPPVSNSTLGDRHNHRSWASNNSDSPFLMGSYPAVVGAWTEHNNQVNNAGAMNNEEGLLVATGYATLSSQLVDWVVVFEQGHAEVVSPIIHLRNIVLACVFGTTGVLFCFMFPVAHYSVSPIRQLRAATQKTVEPYIPESMGSCS